MACQLGRALALARLCLHAARSGMTVAAAEGPVLDREQVGRAIGRTGIVRERDAGLADRRELGAALGDDLVLVGGRFARDEQVETVRGLMEAVGTAVTVGEKDMDAVTAVSGSGPAYVFLVAEAMTAALMDWETIDAEQVKALMEGRKPNPPPGWVGKQPKDVDKDDSTPPPVLVDPTPQT